MGVVIRKFCDREQVFLVGYFVVNEGSKVDFEGLVDSLCLTVSFRVERYAYSGFDPDEFKEVSL